jgi:ABC-2 type transport system ATP-binding protein
MFKVQISLKNDFSQDSFKDIEVLNYKKIGSVATIIVNDKNKDTKEKLEKLNPIILDFLPLTLEEVFIYEMEALGYEFNEII